MPPPVYGVVVNGREDAEFRTDRQTPGNSHFEPCAEIQRGREYILLTVAHGQEMIGMTFRDNPEPEQDIRLDTLLKETIVNVTGQRPALAVD